MAQDLLEQAPVRAAFHALADLLPARTAISALDRELRIVEANDAFVTRFQSRFGTLPVQGIPLDLLLPPSPEGADLLALWRRGLSGERFELQLRESGGPDGGGIRLSMIPVRAESAGADAPACPGAVMIEAPAQDRHAGRDGLRHADADAVRRKIEERLRIVVTSGRYGIWEIGLGTGPWSMTLDDRAKEIFDIRQDGLPLDHLDGLLHPEDRARRRRTLQEAFGPAGSGRLDMEYRIRGPGEGWRWIRTMGTVLPGEAEAVGLVEDVTERHEAARAVERMRLSAAASEERARLATEMAGLGFWETDLEKGRSVWSVRCKELHGLPADASISKMRFWRLVQHEDRAHLWKALSWALGSQGDGTFSAEYRVTRPREGIRWMRVQGAVRFAELPSGRRATHMLGTSMDITDQRRSEERLRASLAEKEMLLREVHHRVKNNLQSLWGLLQIEAVRIGDPVFRSRLEAIAQRIAVLGRIHQQLYSGANLVRIDVGRYLDELAADLQSAIGEPRNLVLSISADRFGCDIDTAIPLGLIANELVSNSIRHAFPDGRRGQIVLRLAGTPGGSVLFEVADNGVGGAVDGEGTGIGSMLVSALADQLDATVHIATDRGRRTTLTIPARRFRPLAACS
jgi:two-component sensor histidine kinase/PAS domain-containing protein